MQLFVYHTPEATPSDSLPDCAVVIDVLRATTTIATALEAGADSVQAFSDIGRLLQVSEDWDADKRLRIGERGGQKVEGCDQGNSPLEFTPERTQGKRVFISTTNGTRALQRVENATTVVTAAQVNRQAVAQYLQDAQPETVWLVGSGWQGGYSLEDTAGAGAIAQALQGFTVGNDETIAAIALYEKWHNDLVELFQQASHGQRLLGLDGQADLEYCARTDILDLVPIQKEPGVLVKL